MTKEIDDIAMEFETGIGEIGQDFRIKRIKTPMLLMQTCGSDAVDIDSEVDPSSEATSELESMESEFILCRLLIRFQSLYI